MILPFLHFLIYSNKFLSIENYVNIVEFDTNLIRVKTKEKIVKI
ncbi:YabP/YqfC family sporulation protein, partial [uncultured Fusobacterium sp.]